MKKSVFFTELKDALMLEDDSINESTQVRLTSLSTLGVIAFIDENFNKQVKAADLREVKIIDDLINLIGPENLVA
ncbi:MAG: hypothetical protein LLG13_17915 [Bacteroidales bacterium]|nr:hypothetical protein [Bacteroidales bacterium]